MRPLRNTQFILFFYLSFLIVSKSLMKHDQFTVELLLYSGRESPNIVISSNEYQSILNKIIQNTQPSTNHINNSHVMGYKGFQVINVKYPKFYKLIKNLPDAELYLLSKFKEKLSQTVYDYIISQIHKFKDLILLNKALPTTSVVKSEQYNCNLLPIRGTDSVPDFNPEKDNSGCFVENMALNNCYNYGNDIVSNTFAQPGRGSGRRSKILTCEDITEAAKSDGLKWVGKVLPSEKKPELGHYVALIMWEFQDFHWIRLDSNGYWSHKPGKTEIINIDNNGNLIENPSLQDFSPWNLFCGYFVSIPSRITIN